MLCSTVPCAYVQSLEASLAAIGRSDILLVDCPVSGGAGRAADGTLSIMAGGSEVALARGTELLHALADPKKLYIVAGGVGAGSNMKMCHQVLAANQILSSSEAMGFAASLGVDLATAREAILASDGVSWMFDHRSPRMLTAYQPIASAVNIIVKDTGIITSEARRAEFPVPMTSAAEQVYFAAVARGWGPDDDSGLVRVYTDGREIHTEPHGNGSNGEDPSQAKMKSVVALLKGIHLCSAAETLAFASHLGLDLDQVFELCINAAGDSKMLKSIGPDIIKAFQEGRAAQSWAVEGTSQSLQSIAKELQEAIREAQAIKVPLFLGSQALNVIRLALRAGSKTASAADMAMGSVVGVWTA
jgi:3-hydroxyisobutyrate dehydrogenase-like beta-hydroxyacid dehydrogenase